MSTNPFEIDAKNKLKEICEKLKTANATDRGEILQGDEMLSLIADLDDMMTVVKALPNDSSVQNFFDVISEKKQTKLVESIVNSLPNYKALDKTLDTLSKDNLESLFQVFVDRCGNEKPALNSDSIRLLVFCVKRMPDQKDRVKLFKDAIEKDANVFAEASEKDFKDLCGCFDTEEHKSEVIVRAILEQVKKYEKFLKANKEPAESPKLAKLNSYKELLETAVWQKDYKGNLKRFCDDFDKETRKMFQGSWFERQINRLINVVSEVILKKRSERMTHQDFTSAVKAKKTLFKPEVPKEKPSEAKQDTPSKGHGKKS